MRTDGSEALPNTAEMSLSRKLLDDFTVVLHDDNRDAVGGQRRADAPADTSVPDDHHVSGKAIEIDRHRQHGKRIIGARQSMGAPVVVAAQLVDDGPLPERHADKVSGPSDHMRSDRRRQENKRIVARARVVTPSSPK